MKFMRTNIRKRSGTVRKNTASGKSPQAARKGLLVRSHVPLYLFALCFLAGMVLGVVMSLRTGEETLQRFDFLFHTSAAIRLEEPVSSIFAASFASSFLRHEKRGLYGQSPRFLRNYIIYVYTGAALPHAAHTSQRTRTNAHTLLPSMWYLPS